MIVEQFGAKNVLNFPNCGLEKKNIARRRFVRLGVCTGGGDCPGLNAAIRAITKHAIGSFGAEVIGIKDSFNGLMNRPMQIIPLGLDKVTEILTRGGTILGTSNRGSPFKDPTRRDAAISATIEGYNSLGLDCLIVIGGEGTQGMSSALSEKGMKIIGVPKTIDNDLPGTDQTIGFATAVDIVSEAVIRLQSTAESHDRVMILEVMGRDSGYIALHGGLAGGANIILIPEIPFSYEQIVKKVTERKQLGRNFSVIVVAEGCMEIGGQMVYQEAGTGPQNLGGIGSQIAGKLNRETGMDTRVTVLGHVQRGGAPNSLDRIFAIQMGVRAVELAAKKQYGRFVGLRNGRITDVLYTDIEADARQKIVLTDTTLLAAEAIGVNLGRPTKFKAMVD
jgi:6-phosphofructokinase 1